MAISVNAKSLGIKSPPGGQTDTSSLRKVGSSKVRIGDRVLDKATSIREIRTLSGLQRLSSQGATNISPVLAPEMSTLTAMSAIGISVAPVKTAAYQLISEVTEPFLIANPNILDRPVVLAPGSTDSLKSIDKSFPDLSDPIHQPDSTIVPASSVISTAVLRLETGKKSGKLISDLCMINLSPSYNSTTKYFKEPEISSTSSTYKRPSKTIVLEAEVEAPKKRKTTISDTGKTPSRTSTADQRATLTGMQVSKSKTLKGRKQ